jgi:flavin reductase (DIM6/NTAB) family NADH-FMN oxidoreductase RutF
VTIAYLDREPDRPPGVGAADLRSVMRHHASSVAIVTTGVRRTDGSLAPVGCTVTSLVSVSLDPPMVSFSLRGGSSAERAWRFARYGAVNLLHEGQERLSRRFAGVHVERFGGGVGWHWDAGCPLLDDALGRLTVEPHQRVAAGDHVLILAVVTGTHIATDRRRPLLHHDGGYAGVGRRL